MATTANPDMAQVIRQAVTDSGAQGASAGEQPASGQAQASEQPPEYFGKQITPEQWNALTPEVRQSLSTWGKSVYTNAQQKTQEASSVRERLNKYEPMLNELEANPDLATHLEQSYHLFKSGKSGQVTAHEAKQEASDIFEELMAEASDAATREKLGKLKSGILKLTGTEDLRRELKELKNAFQTRVQADQLTRSEALRSDLAKVTKAWEPLVEKYGDAIVKLGVQNPTMPLRRLFQAASTPEEYDQAVLGDRDVQTKTTVTQAKRSAPPAKSTVGTVQVGEGDKIASKDPKIYGSRWNIRSLMAKTMPEVLAEKPS